MRTIILGVLFTLLFLTSGNAQSPLRIQETGFAIDANTGEKRTASDYRYQYDASGKIRVIQYSTWNDTKQIIGPVYRVEYDYDTEGRKIKERNYSFMNHSDTVSLTRIYDTEYDSNGRIKVYSITETFFNNPDVYTSTFFYTYSPEGCLIRMDYQARLNGTGSNDYTVHYTVDDQCRNLLTQTSFTDPFNAARFETFEYEGINLTANREYFIQGQDTVLSYEYLYEYNAQNLKIIEQRTNDYRSETQYNNFGKPTLVTYYRWSQQLNDWVDPSITFYKYNNQGLLQELNASYISAESSYSYLFQYEYNEMGKETKVYSRLWLTFENDIIIINEYEILINYRCDGVELSREFYTINGGVRQYTNGTSIVYMLPAPCEQVTEQIFQVYPNPTTGPVTLVPAQPLESYVIRIFNSSGQFILEYTSDQGISPAYMDFSSLPAGPYIIIVTNGSYFASSQLVRN